MILTLYPRLGSYPGHVPHRSGALNLWLLLESSNEFSPMGSGSSN